MISSGSPLRIANAGATTDDHQPRKCGARIRVRLLLVNCEWHKGEVSAQAGIALPRIWIARTCAVLKSLFLSCACDGCVTPPQMREGWFDPAGAVVRQRYM